MEMRTTNSFALLIFIAILGVGVALAYAMYGTSTNWGSIWIIAGAFVIGLVVSYGTRVANQWDKAVVLRLGRFRALKGPGLFFIIPVIDVVAYWIDTRVITSSFKAEKTLPKTRCRSLLMQCYFEKSWTRRKRPWMLPTIKAQ
jgi:regulator of protease activity HflC (stomatin/prohibitin superfamily)